MKVTINLDYVFGGIVGFLIALFLSVTVFFYQTPSINCPSEDSCYADYYGGAWHIIHGERP